MKNKMLIFSFKNVLNLKDRNLISSFITIATGLVCGVILYRVATDGILNELYTLFIDFNTVFSDKTPLEIFSGIAVSGIIYFILMFILGGSIFGKLLCPLISLSKAVGIGVLASYFYCDFGLKGFEYALLVFFPGKFILLFAMLLLTRICIANSGEIINREGTEVSIKIKNYCLKTIVVFFFFLMSWTVDLLCIVIFSDLFNFT